MKKRIQWIDVAKGLLIIFVVFGHSEIPSTAQLIINSFHMAAFFVLAGFTFNANRPTKEFILKRTKSILIPYFLFAALLLTEKFLVHRFIAPNAFDLLHGIISIFVPVSGSAYTSVYALWFLPCIFLSELVLFFIEKIKQFWLRCLCLIGSMLICVSIHYLTGVTSIISLLPLACFFILFGKKAKQYIYLVQEKKGLVALISLLLFAACVATNAFLSNHTGFDFSSLNTGILPLYILSGICGSAFIICVSMVIEKVKILQLIGKNSLYYYGFHYIILSVAEKLIPFGWLCAIATLIVLFPIVSAYVFLKNQVITKLGEKHD